MAEAIISLFDWIMYWMPEIRKQLGIINDDVESIIKYQHLKNTRNNFEDLKAKRVIVVGAADVLEDHLLEIENKHLITSLENEYIVAIDGTVNYLQAKGIKFHTIFTDLDGDIKKIAQCANHGVSVFVLIHGDNHQAVEEFMSLTKDCKNIYWCTQGLPLFEFINTKGFTDGDRAVVYFAEKQLPVLTIGFDLFSNNIGRFSTHKKIVSEDYKRRKLLKLQIAAKILKEINASQLLYTLDASLCPGNEISLEEFLTVE